jgi:hypothetical protein
MAIPGTWDLYYDWERDGTYNMQFITFNDDGTWTAGEFNTGRWWEFSGKLIFKTDDPKGAIYFGTITGGVVAGFMTEGYYHTNGLWFMIPHIPALKEGAPSRDLAGKPTAG